MSEQDNPEPPSPPAPPASTRVPSVAELSELLYAELREIAGHVFRRERADHTLQPTAVVHEAFLRLAGSRSLEIVDRVHFLRLAARTMRRVLAEHARRPLPGSGRDAEARVTLTDDLAGPNDWQVPVCELDQALERLRAVSPRDADIVELRCFAGMSHAEIASALGISVSTAEKSWRYARSWLAVELG